MGARHHAFLRKVPDSLAKSGFSQPQNKLNERPRVPGRLQPAPSASLTPSPPRHLTLSKSKELTDPHLRGRPGSPAGAAATATAPLEASLFALPRGCKHPALTAIKFERLKYCLRRKAKCLSMCLQVLSVCWAFVNTGTIWAPNSCAQNVGFPIQTGFPAANSAEGPPARQWLSSRPYLGGRPNLPSLRSSPVSFPIKKPCGAGRGGLG